MAGDEADGHGREPQDLLLWLALVATGLALTWLAVRDGARLGTAGAPFLGTYRFEVGPASLLAPAVAATVLTLAALRWWERLPWSAVLVTGYLAGYAWAMSLALVDGAAGLTRALIDTGGHLVDVGDVGDEPLAYLRAFTSHTTDQSPATRGHPPAPVLLLWALHRAGITSHLAIGLLVAAFGTLIVPLVLGAVRGVCGQLPARRYLPVLALAPYAIWVAVSMDAVVAALGAAMVGAGVRASDARRTGPRAAGWAAAAGLLLGVAALFSYAVPWLGLSVVFLYFARRRAALNLVTGVSAVVPVAVVQLLGFRWVDGLLAAQQDFATRIETHRSALWWSGISIVALLLAAGPPLCASLRKLRNTPGWPFLVGAGTAVAFTVLAGLARGGVEHAWLTFFPWLTVAAVAPERPGGPPAAAPLLLAGAGAVCAVVIQAVLSTG